MAHAQKPDFVFRRNGRSPFKSAGASVQSTAGSRGVRINGSNAGYSMFRGSVRVLATHSIRQFPLHFPSRASPCAIRFQTHTTTPRPLYPRVTPGAYCTGGWMGLGSGLNRRADLIFPGFDPRTVHCH